jgi:hypothetical protein
VTLYDVGPVTFPAYESDDGRDAGGGRSDEAKRALPEGHRQEQKPANRRVGKLAAYQARARACRGVGVAVRRAPGRLAPPVDEAIPDHGLGGGHHGVRGAGQETGGASTEDADVLAAIAAADLALDQCDAIFDGLLGEPADAQD